MIWTICSLRPSTDWFRFTWMFVFSDVGHFEPLKKTVFCSPFCLEAPIVYSWLSWKCHIRPYGFPHSLVPHAIFSWTGWLSSPSRIKTESSQWFFRFYWTLLLIFLIILVIVLFTSQIVLYVLYHFCRSASILIFFYVIPFFKSQISGSSHPSFLWDCSADTHCFLAWGHAFLFLM